MPDCGSGGSQAAFRFGQVSVGARSVIGLAVGASITPALVGRLPDMALSIAIVPVYVIAIAAVGMPFFQQCCRFDPITAFYSAMPGGAADMTVFGMEAGANVRSCLVRYTVAGDYGDRADTPGRALWVSLDNPVGAPAGNSCHRDGSDGDRSGRRLEERRSHQAVRRRFNIGPLLVAALLSLTGLLHARPPKALLAASF